MITRHSLSRISSRASTAGAILRLPALTHTARRPASSGIVCASSTRREGSAVTSSPSSRASANGSLGSSTDSLTRTFTRSLTNPASGPNTSTTGRLGSGRATKASTSAALIAVMTSRHHVDDALRHDDHLLGRFALQGLLDGVERQHCRFDFRVAGIARHGDVGALFAVDLHRQRYRLLD